MIVLVKAEIEIRFPNRFPRISGLSWEGPKFRMAISNGMPWSSKLCPLIR